jgi:uncharacterized membrane protein required for colicin V production
MEMLQRLQPLDIFFAILWAGIVGWGLQTGFVRQLGMLVATYGAALLSGSLYRQAGQALALAFGKESIAIFEFIGYVFVFALAFGVVSLIIWRTYPASRIGRHFGIENVLGAAVGAIWGVLFLIAMLTILRFYAVVPWHEQETSQRGVLGQVQLSQAAPVLEVVAAPLWQIMVPWFPAQVPPQL